MKWKYKYEAGMDTNDADYVYQSGELGVFDDDSCAHDLGFSFSRLPADVIEQNVDDYCLRQYYNVNKG